MQLEISPVAPSPPDLSARDIEIQIERSEKHEHESEVRDFRELRYSSSPVVRPPIFVFWKAIIATATCLMVLACAIATREGQHVPAVCASLFAAMASILSAWRVLRFYLVEESCADPESPPEAGFFVERNQGNRKWYKYVFTCFHDALDTSGPLPLPYNSFLFLDSKDGGGKKFFKKEMISFLKYKVKHCSPSQKKSVAAQMFSRGTIVHLDFKIPIPWTE